MRERGYLLSSEPAKRGLHGSRCYDRSSTCHAPKGAAARCCSVVALGRAWKERLCVVAPVFSASPMSDPLDRISGNQTAIHAKRVRYIKLGREGRWEKECAEQGIIRFGYGSATADRFPLCRQLRWSDLTQSFIEAGKDKGTATRFTNETRLFFEDDDSGLLTTLLRERVGF